jgi:hypothetical protein
MFSILNWFASRISSTQREQVRTLALARASRRTSAASRLMVCASKCAPRTCSRFVLKRFAKIPLAAGRAAHTLWMHGSPGRRNEVPFVASLR